MSENIVERLRRDAAFLRERTEHKRTAATMEDGANEIERLSRDYVGAHRVSILTIRHLETEIERLTAALLKDATSAPPAEPQSSSAPQPRMQLPPVGR